MANEITIGGSLSYVKGTASSKLSTSFRADQTGNKYEGGIQTIGVTEETLQKNDIGTIGYMSVKNLDEDNFVQLGAGAGEYTIKLKPGEGCVVPWDGTAVYIKADTAPVIVEYLLIEA